LFGWSKTKLDDCLWRKICALKNKSWSKIYEQKNTSKIE
jgi:hypothetical protein